VPTGYFIGWEDYWTFITKIDWGSLGNWTYTNQMTPEAVGPVPIYLFYLLLGHISKWTGLSVMWVFHLARSAVGAAFLWMWWSFCRRHTEHYIVTAIIGLFASFGFLSLLPIASAEYLELAVQAHAAVAGLLGFTHYLFDGMAFLLLLEAYLSGEHIEVRSLAAGAMLGMVHPFLLPLIPGVLIVHSAIRREFKAAIKISFWAAIGSLPFVVPMFSAYLAEPWLKTWREQTAISFLWWETLILVSLTFGLAGIVAWANLPRALKGNCLQQISAVWLVLAALLVFFAPLPNSREYGFFLSIPVSIIAAPVIVRFSERVNTMKVNLVLISLIIFCCAHGARSTLDVWAPNEFTYVSKEMIAGLEWLKSKPKGIVACSADVGLMVPHFTGHRPWVAHTSETIDSRVKNEQMRRMFKAGKLIPADYAFLTKKFDKKAPELPWKPAYENPEIKIWKLSKGADYEQSKN